MKEIENIPPFEANQLRETRILYDELLEALRRKHG
jgi:hypothetical protein